MTLYYDPDFCACALFCKDIEFSCSTLLCSSVYRLSTVESNGSMHFPVCHMCRSVRVDTGADDCLHNEANSRQLFQLVVKWALDSLQKLSSSASVEILTEEVGFLSVPSVNG